MCSGCLPWPSVRWLVPAGDDCIEATSRCVWSGALTDLQDRASGKFVLPDDVNQPVVFLGGGIGITTFRSMMRFATDENLPTSITLLYSVKTPADIVFRKELEHLPEENPRIKIFTTISDPEESDEPWSGETGRIDADMIMAHVDPDSSPLYYISGPPKMIKDLSDLLKEIGIPERAIKTEEYSGYD